MHKSFVSHMQYNTIQKNCQNTYFSLVNDSFYNFCNIKLNLFKIPDTTYKKYQKQIKVNRKNSKHKITY